MPTDRKVIALTFDGGASADGVDQILATLSDKGVPATFFVTGDFATKHPDATKAIAARYIVGNHSTTHPDLTTKSDAQVRWEIETAQQQIQDVTGRDPRPYFRFPFGARDARTIGIVNDECYVPFRWTTDSLGWKGTSGGMSVDKVRERVVSDLEPGGILLMHLGANPDDGSTLDADALPGIIDGARTKGYDFVTLDDVVR